MEFLKTVFYLPAAIWWTIKSPFVYLVRRKGDNYKFDIVFFRHRWATKSFDWITVKPDPDANLEDVAHPLDVIKRVGEFYHNQGYRVYIVSEGKEVERGSYGKQHSDI